MDRQRREHPDQLLLKLPWGGRSPRCLTRAHMRFNLEPSGDDATMEFDDEVLNEQYRRFIQDEEE